MAVLSFGADQLGIGCMKRSVDRSAEAAGRQEEAVEKDRVRATHAYRGLALLV